MEGLSSLLNSLSETLSPIFNFLIWAFPLKIYKIHDGEGGVIRTFGKTRDWRNFDRNPGITMCFSFEEIDIIQTQGGYIDLLEQTIMAKNDKMAIINVAIVNDLRDPRIVLAIIVLLDTFSDPPESLFRL